MKYKLYTFNLFDSGTLSWSGVIASKSKKKALKKLTRKMPGHSMYEVNRLRIKNFKIMVERVNE